MRRCATVLANVLKMWQCATVLNECLKNLGTKSTNVTNITLYEDLVLFANTKKKKKKN